MRIHFLQHELSEQPGYLSDWASKQPHATVTFTKFFEEKYILPDIKPLDLLIILGGSMGANDDALHPWMPAEKQYIGNAIHAGIKVLGICLGAQLIATVLGANVSRNEHLEIGWHPVYATENAKDYPPFQSLPESFTTFHWHGDTFDVPGGATPLAYSEACKNQAFAYKNHVLALQFHPEMNEESIAALAAASDHPPKAAFVQTIQEIEAKKHLIEVNNQFLDRILQRFLSL